MGRILLCVKQLLVCRRTTKYSNFSPSILLHCFMLGGSRLPVKRARLFFSEVCVSGQNCRIDIEEALTSLYLRETMTPRHLFQIMKPIYLISRKCEEWSSLLMVYPFQKFSNVRPLRANSCIALLSKDIHQNKADKSQKSRFLWLLIYHECSLNQHIRKEEEVQSIFATLKK